MLSTGGVPDHDGWIWFAGRPRCTPSRAGNARDGANAVTPIDTALAAQVPPDVPAEGDLVIECRAADPRAWCEALPAAAGRTVLVSGRVLGDTPSFASGTEPHTDQRAVRLAGQLRMAVRAITKVDLPPAEALGQLDSLVSEWEEPFRARLLYGVFDPVDGAFCFGQAGHPGPVICQLKGEATAPPAPEGGPLGGFAGMSASYGEQTVAIPPGGSVAIMLPAVLADDVEFTTFTAPPPHDGVVAAAQPALETVSSAVAASLAANLCDPIALVDEVGAKQGPAGGSVLVAGWPSGLTVGPVRVIELELGEGDDPTRRARAFCYGVLSTWQLPPLVRDDIVLAVSELVANALLYGGAAEQLRLRRSATRIVIEVFDREPTMPRPRIADADAESGRGLFLVRRVARRWGARAVPGGKAVWCEFDLTAPRDDDEEEPTPIEAACG